MFTERLLVPCRKHGGVFSAVYNFTLLLLEVHTVQHKHFTFFQKDCIQKWLGKSTDKLVKQLP